MQNESSVHPLYKKSTGTIKESQHTIPHQTMKHDLFIQEGLSIPMHEIGFITSRGGGPGGQHVNKTNSRVTVRWQVMHSTALNDTQKAQLTGKLHNRLTTDGYLVIHSSSSRSQHTNKEQALILLAAIVRKALQITKKRIATKAGQSAHERRLRTKSRRSDIKKLRSKPID